MTVHLPPLFTILGVGFASLLVGFLVAGILGGWAFLHFDSGPQWYWNLPIPCGILAAVVSGFFFARLT
jgi:hypothetical protein